MNIDKLKEVLREQPKFRYKQVWQAVFVDLIEDWNENTTLPKALRDKLNEECPLTIKSTAFDSNNTDTIKALIQLEDNSLIETVLMLHKDGRNTVCVSSQVGCPVGCAFCATGTLGLGRNLTVSEIILQVLFFARYLKKNEAENNRITNVVYMGMGEPFLNYDNVMASVKMLNDKDAFNIGARHISISTSGIVTGIKKFAKEPLQLNLAISLHAPNNELRSSLMPINDRFPIEKVMQAVEEYKEARDRQIMFEYLMMDGINDKEIHAKQLVELLGNDTTLYMVNLIRYNPTGKFRPSQTQNIKKFKNILLRAGIKTTERFAFGQDINAACGQLALKNRKKN
ncbi:MAG: 23S rRNA (adenine(2503)-C(2))-methyltransferase RlmN [Candidatus Magasanikbacteria bacterium]